MQEGTQNEKNEPNDTRGEVNSGVAHEGDHVLIGREPEFMARDGPGHLVKKGEREGECVAAITPSASG
jgi:hypothetical protein